MKQFEYKTLEFEPKGKWFKSIKMDSSELEVQLNDMGKNGWELVNSINHSIEGNTAKVIMLFKRENVKQNS